jgi:hypothetical protein
MNLAGHKCMPIVVMRQHRSLYLCESFPIQCTNSPHSFDRRKALIIVDHDCDFIADGLSNRSHDFYIFLDACIANLCFNTFEASFGPGFRTARNLSHRHIPRRHTRGRASQLQADQRSGSTACQDIPISPYRSQPVPSPADLQDPEA